MKLTFSISIFIVFYPIFLYIKQGVQIYSDMSVLTKTFPGLKVITNNNNQNMSGYILLFINEMAKIIFSF